MKRSNLKMMVRKICERYITHKLKLRNWIKRVVFKVAVGENVWLGSSVTWKYNIIAAAKKEE